MIRTYKSPTGRSNASSRALHSCMMSCSLGCVSVSAMCRRMRSRNFPRSRCTCVATTSAETQPRRHLRIRLRLRNVRREKLPQLRKLRALPRRLAQRLQFPQRRLIRHQRPPPVKGLFRRPSVRRLRSEPSLGPCVVQRHMLRPAPALLRPLPTDAIRDEVCERRHQECPQPLYLFRCKRLGAQPLAAFQALAHGDRGMRLGEFVQREQHPAGEACVEIAHGSFDPQAAGLTSVTGIT